MEDCKQFINGKNAQKIIQQMQDLKAFLEQEPKPSDEEIINYVKTKLLADRETGKFWLCLFQKLSECQ